MEDIELVVGRIGKPHGIRGDVTIDVRTDEPQRRFAPGTTLRAQPPQGSHSPLRSLTVVRAKWHQNVLLATFEEIGDRNAAEAARGIVLHTTISADEVPEDPDEYYDHQLVGLAAYDLDGTHLGELTAVQHGPRRTCSRSAPPTVATPWCRSSAALVPEVDVPGGRVVIADRPGLVAPFPDEDEAAR